MGTNVLTPTASQNSVTLPELQDFSEPASRYRFGRQFFSPMMVSELTKPMTPLNLMESHSLLTIDLLVAGMTAAAPLRVAKQTFNMFFLGRPNVLFTEVHLTPAVWYSTPWIASAIKRLNDFQGWPPNWDEAGALAFTAETLDAARDILQRMWNFSARREIRSRPNVAPLEDGSVRFEWVNKDKELFLTILGNSIEVQKWQPLDAVESQAYQVVSAPAVENELEWLAA